MHFHILYIPTKQYSGDQKKQLNGKGAPTKSTAVKAKPTPAKPAKSGSYKLVVKSPMPSKAAKSTAKPIKARPTAVEILLSKINPTTASKSTISTIKNGNGKSAASKSNGLAKANSNGNGRATGAKANGKADAKPTAQARVNGNGKVVVEKKVILNAKSSAERKSSANGKVTIVTKSNGAAEKKTSGSGKATIEVKEIKIKVHGKPENKVSGEAKANGKMITVVEKKFTNGAANRAKIETTARAKTEKVIKIEKIEKTVLSTAKSATKLDASKAAKPTKVTILTKPTKAAAAGKTQARAEVKEVTHVKTVIKVPLVKTTVNKAAKNVVERVTLPRKVASTSMPVRPTPPRPTKTKMAVDINVKSQHKPFPPFGKTALSGTSIPGRKITNGYQQVQWSGPCLGQGGRSVWPICPTLLPGPSTIQGVQRNLNESLRVVTCVWRCGF